MLFSTKNWIAVIVLFLFSSGVSSLPAFANNKTDSEAKPLFITVRKQPEQVSRIPAVAYLIDKKAISDASVSSPTDISALVPGFSFNDPFGRFNPAPSFRGLIQQGLGDDPSVGFFNDGLYLSGRSSINSLSFDLEKIEAVKGPQNALYGRNSFGGAINVISAKPTSRSEYWFDGKVGTHDRNEIQTGINVPINDAVKTRLALYRRDWGGFFDNAVEGGPDLGREKTQAGRLSFLFTPNPERDVLLQITHLSDDDSQPNGFLVPANCGPRAGDNQLRLFCGELPERAEIYEANDVGTEQKMGYQREHTRFGAEWTERFTYQTSMTTLIGGSIEDATFIRDDDYQVVNAARAGIDTDRFDAQIDMRINHETVDKRWQGLIGVSGYKFFNKVDRIDQNYILGQTSPGGPKVKNGTRTAGVYGSVTHNFHYGFALTGDARWQWEGKDLKSTTTAITTGQPLDLEQSWAAFAPKLTASWTAENGFMAYSSVAKGYKTGGFNDRSNIFDEERAYQPEENMTYELGTKNIPLASTLQGDMGVFWIDWTKQQVTAYSTAAATQNFFINNAGETTSKGVEMALRWQPLESLSMSFGYTYADARYDEYKDPDLANVAGSKPGGDVSGNQLPRYSPHQATLTGSYKTPSFIDRWDYVLGGQFTYESSQYTDNSNTSETGARTLLNLQAGLENGNIGVGFWVDNVLNEKDPAVGIPWTDAAQAFRREWLVVPQEGTTAGVRFKIKW